MNWTQAVSLIDNFSPRDIAEIAVINGRVIVASGHGGGSNDYRDFWRGADPAISSAGLAQIIAHPNAPFPAYARLAVIGDRILAISNLFHYSDDGGANWTLVSGTTPLGSDYSAFKALTVDDRAWLVGPGIIRSVNADGDDWQTVDAAPAYGDLNDFGVAVFGSGLLVFGGDWNVANVPVESGYTTKRSSPYYYLRSSAGVWTEHVAPFGPRMWPACAAHEGKVVMFGGYNNQLQLDWNDTWLFDGAWSRLNTASVPSARHGASLVSHYGRVLCVAGKGTSHQRDVWVLNLD